MHFLGYVVNGIILKFMNFTVKPVLRSHTREAQKVAA